MMQALDKLLEQAVAPSNKLTSSAHAALLQLVDDFLAGAVAFGCGLARRRKAGRLECADIATYLEQTWWVIAQLQLPCFPAAYTDSRCLQYKLCLISILLNTSSAAVLRHVYGSGMTFSMGGVPTYRWLFLVIAGMNSQCA